MTIRDVSLILGVSEKEVIDLAESSQIPAYKIGGVFLRFKRQQIEEFKKKFKPHVHKTFSTEKNSFKDKIGDFFYFNDFYILAALIIFLMLIIIFQG